MAVYGTEPLKWARGQKGKRKNKKDEQYTSLKLVFSLFDRYLHKLHDRKETWKHKLYR